MCSGFVILGLVLALVLAQERQDNLIHVRLADEVSLYNHQICRPWFLTFPKGHGERYWTKTHVDPNIEILWKMAWRPVNFDIDFFKPLLVLQTQTKHPSKEKWTHYDTVKFKCLKLF